MPKPLSISIYVKAVFMLTKIELRQFCTDLKKVRYKNVLHEIKLEHRVDDLIAFYEKTGEYQRAEMYRRQYRAPEHVNDVCHFFDFFHYKHGSPYAIENFKHKLWVVALLDVEEKQPRIPLMVHVLNFLAYPLKYIPQRSVLRMPEYTNYTYRVGGVTNGYSVEFQVPKKFSFNNK